MSNAEASESYDAILDLVELLGKVSDSPWLEEAPILGKILKAAKLGQGFQERSFVKKLALFIQTLDGFSEKELHDMRRKAAVSQKELKDVGERVSQALALSLDFQKPQVYAKLFLALMDGHLTSMELGRLIATVGSLHTPDALKFAALVNPHQGNPGNAPAAQDPPWVLTPELGAPLMPAGFTRPNSMVGTADKFFVSDYGRTFHTAMNHANQVLGQHRRLA